MRGGHHRDGISRRIKAERAQFLENRGETFLQLFGIEMRYVEMDERNTLFEDFGVDCSGDDVAGREFAARVVIEHEPSSMNRSEDCAFASEGFRYEEVSGFSVIEGRRMELNEFHIFDCRADCGGQSDAVACCDRGVRGEAINLAAASSCEHGGAAAHFDCLCVFGLQDGACAFAVFVAKRFAERVFHQLYIGLFSDRFRKCSFDFPSGLVGMVDDSAAAVTAFSCELELWEGATRDIVESRAHFDQPLEAGSCILHEKPDGFLFAKSRASNQSIFFVQFPRVTFTYCCCDPPLSPAGIRIAKLGLSDDEDFSVIGGLEGESQTGDSAADDQEIRFDCHVSLARNGRLSRIPALGIHHEQRNTPELLDRWV